MSSAAKEVTGRDSARREVSINLRLPIEVKNLIDKAAAISGKTRAEFVIESAKQHATDVLLDQRVFVLEGDQWEAFNRILENPPPPNERLKRLMARKPAWGK